MLQGDASILWSWKPDGTAGIASIEIRAGEALSRRRRLPKNWTPELTCSGLIGLDATAERPKALTVRLDGLKLKITSVILPPPDGSLLPRRADQILAHHVPGVLAPELRPPIDVAQAVAPAHPGADSPGYFTGSSLRFAKRHPPASSLASSRRATSSNWKTGSITSCSRRCRR